MHFPFVELRASRRSLHNAAREPARGGILSRAKTVSGDDDETAKCLAKTRSASVKESVFGDLITLAPVLITDHF
jgi:hypothetical protein